MPFVSSIFRMFPSVRMGNVREPSMYLGAGMTSCEANYFVDRFRVDKIIFHSCAVQDIAWVEAYPRRTTVPREFMGW